MTNLSVVAADCTFKVTVEGYPLLVVAVIDNMRHAHPVAFGIIANQEHTDYQFAFQSILQASSKLGFRVVVTAFLSDGELALKNAARAVFDEPKLLNCYFHFTQNLDKHLKKYHEVPVELHNEIKRNIGILQVAPTEQHFIAGAKLFLVKYKRFPNFMNFMKKYVQDPNFCLWYEAAMPAVPATNNALEALNKSIKYNFLNRYKEPLASFKVLILNIIYEYGDPQRNIVLERSVTTLENQRKTFDWIKEKKKMRSVQAPLEQKQYVFLPGKNKTEVAINDMTLFDNPIYSTFERFAEDFGSVYRVDVSNVNWRSWSCTCYSFLKNNNCCHVLAVAVRRGLYALSAEADTTAVGQKKSAGRPKLSSKALIID
ncbi:uncharacterized protein LOC110678751 isoform X1 [Aedes aegypti]|uniref:SWIM-type domain-containing protein n=1 Tax=Aedes aegypti TaxID=7159 RepID=A0A6I8TYD3_AEDAE|nr:uncharacterized protein LOC110676512 isoform X1 [Aedes aegypti]XP_021700375.1 uncharacterized protein LOC110676512 isoform X1 [Aedes aegypti]XP_021700379.1 uncharacterized protein LOC110676513 isoform X1 [Aedes aegypti]XP_021707728.1 uncharacterized protein LOC110678751 isoform X1 [Aedes aegypti]XP_021707729.1 uncharacterized protein LOC110678751 isoform X1 [Aedes aegypti]